MSKKKIEIKDICVIRIRELIAEHFHSQKGLCDATKVNGAPGISTVQLNRIMKMKVGLSKEVAEVIANAVPDEIIRYQWLLGEDEYKTEAAAIIARIKTKVDSIQYAQSGFELLLNHIGYERRFNAQTEETTLIKNGTGVVISPSAMRFLESEIVDFLEYRVHKLTGL